MTMKPLSITKKITLLYTIAMLAISGVFIVTLVYAGNREAAASAKTRLMEEVTDASEEISRSRDDIIIDKDIQYYHNGVYLSIYNEKKDFMEGRRPAALRKLPALSDKKQHTLKDSRDRIWYVYDSKFTLSSGQVVWVRGIVNDVTETTTFTTLTRFLGFGIPALILIASLIGFLITRRAFRPVNEAVTTAEKISCDGDFSHRLKESGGNDEVARMTRTFNAMFARLDKSIAEAKQFTNDAAHELRTPLSVILAQSEYALEDEPFREKALTTIHAHADMMNAMVNQLLLLARGDAGRLEVSLEPVDLSELAHDIAEQQEASAQARGMHITVDADKPVIARADVFMTIRILLNFIGNALKYGQSETGAVALAVSSDNDFATIRVTDFGRGIGEEDLSHIWERFYRADRSRNRTSPETDDETPSTGLGLAIVHTLADVQGGTVHAESEPNVRTTFSVSLPIWKEDSDVETH